MRSFDLPDAATLARIRRFADRELTVEEFGAALAVPVSAEEETEAREPIRWFRRRYPTPAERLAYIRRAYRRWTAAQPRHSVRNE